MLKRSGYPPALLCAALLTAAGCGSGHDGHGGHDNHYAGQEKREIKALSDDDLKNLREGDGAGFAKPAELNGYPGPKHILEHEAKLDLTPEQRTAVDRSFRKMKEKAVELGGRIIDRERELDRLFAGQKIDAALLRERTNEIAALQGELRAVHLAAHLEMKELLSDEQVARYKRLRGYTN